MTQKERIKKYLDDFGSITPLEAMRDLGIMRLGARIWDLKRDGEPIIKRMESHKNRYGKTTHYARYCKGEDIIQILKEGKHDGKGFDGSGFIF